MKRFKYWVIECATSVVVMLSLLRLAKDEQSTGDWTEREWKALIFNYVAVAVAFCGLVMSIISRTRRACRVIENVLVVSFAVLWGTAVAVSIAKPGAIEASNDMQYPQLYFTTWACTISSVMSFSSLYTERIYHGDTKTSTQWCLIGFFSLFVMLSSVAFRDLTVDDPDTSDTTQVALCTTAGYSCARVEFAVVLGAVTCPIAFVTFAWRNSPLGCETDVSLLLFIAWCCGAVYLTFGTGPGTAIGNIYFGTWSNLFLCLRIIDVTLSANESSDRTSDVRRNRKSVVGRGDIFDIAYDRLEIPGFTTSESTTDVRSATGALFAPVESWSFLDDSHEILPEAPENDAPAVSEAVGRLSDNVEPTAQGRNRLELWAVVVIGSCVCLAALLPTLPGSQERDRNEQMEVLIPSLSLLIASLGFLLNMGQLRVEAVLIALSIILWLVGVPSIDKGATVAVGSEPGESDLSAKGISNIFFSSAGCLIVSVLLATNWFDASQTATDWTLLSAFSFALTAGTIVYWRTSVDSVDTDGSVSQVPECSVQKDSRNCNRTEFAMWLGAASTVISLIMALLYRAPVLFHMTAGLGMFAAWCCGVVYMTYEPNQGKTASATFFGTWFALFISLDIVTTSIVLFVKRRDKEHKRTGAQEGEVTPPSVGPSSGVDNDQEHLG